MKIKNNKPNIYILLKSYFILIVMITCFVIHDLFFLKLLLWIFEFFHKFLFKLYWSINLIIMEEFLMARFEEAENRMFNVKICLKCNARNPAGATTCREDRFTLSL